MNLFFVDVREEEEFMSKKHSSKPETSEEPSWEFIDIFYTPNKHQTVIDKTDLIVSLVYTPPNRTLGTYISEPGCVSLSTAITNTCRINLSKQGIEQMIQTFDNFVYKTACDEEKLETKIDLDITSDMITSTPNKKPSLRATSNNYSYYQDGNILWTYFERSGLFKFASLLDAGSVSSLLFQQPANRAVDVAVEMRLRFERLDILFLADVEQPLQELAELTFNKYELNISKRNSAYTKMRMSLKSIYLVDKLFDEEKMSSSSAKSGSKSNHYLLWTASNQYGKHTCKQEAAAAAAAVLRSRRMMSMSLPDLSSKTKKRRKRGKVKSSGMANAAYFLNKSYMSELSNQLSTSLPSELAHVCKETRYSLDNNNGI